MSSILRKYASAFTTASVLREDEAEEFLDAMIAESDEVLLADLFRAWDAKGIAEEEIYLFARILRSRAATVNSRHDRFVDIVGTGGSRAKTFNVSTAASFVTAGAGLPVAKHGNKAATSNSGSSDVLGRLGVNPCVDPMTAERCLNEAGICFMFAPNHHRLSPTLGKVRRGLGFATIFNCIGPLCNPASAPHQVIGVWSRAMVPKIAGALARLGTRRSWVVHGEEGLDEISLTGETTVAEVADGTVQTFEITPEYFGSKPVNADGLRASDSGHSARMIVRVLSGRQDPTAAEELVLLNAAAAYALGTGNVPEDAMGAVRESLYSGRAHRKLEELRGMVPA